MKDRKIMPQEPSGKQDGARPFRPKVVSGYAILAEDGGLQTDDERLPIFCDIEAAERHLGDGSNRIAKVCVMIDY